MLDFQVSGDFSATEVVIAATSVAARAFFSTMFGTGAVSITIPKSKAVDLLRFIEAKGFTAA